MSEDIIMNGNQRMALNQPGQLILVKEGLVDLFCTSRDDAGEYGQLDRVLSLEPGRMMFSFAQDGSQNLDLLFRPRKSARLEYLRLSEVEAHHDVMPYFREWACELLNTVSTENQFGSFEELPTGVIQETMPEAIYKPDQDLCWIRSNGGSFELWRGRRKRRSIEPDRIPDGEWVPVGGNMVIRCLEAGALECRDWDELTGQLGLADGLAFLNRWVLLWLNEAASYKAKAEGIRLTQRLFMEEQIMHQALSNVANVITGHEMEEEASSDPLFEACRVLGREMSLHVKQPPAHVPTDAHQIVRLQAIARHSGFRLRSVLLKGQWWKEDCGPLLAFLAGDRTPAALIPRDGGYELYQAGEAPRRLSDKDDPGRLLESEAYTLYAGMPETTKSLGALFRYGLQSIHKGAFVMLLATGIATGLLSLVFPVATGYLYDYVIPAAQKSSMMGLVLLLAASAVTTCFFQISQAIALIRIAGRMKTKIETALWDRLLNLPASFFRKFSAGDLAFRASGIGRTEDFFSGLLTGSLFSSLFAFFNFFYMFYLDAILAWYALGMTLLLVLFILWVQLREMKLLWLISDQQTKLQSLALQLLNGIAKIRVAGMEKRGFYLWSREYTYLRRLEHTERRRVGSIATVHQVFGLITMLILFSVVLLDSNTRQDIGYFLSFLVAFGAFQEAFLSLVETLTDVPELWPGIKLLEPILQEEPEYVRGGQSPGELQGLVELNHVTFGYLKNVKPVLEDLNISILPGQFVGIVGPSGGGKSTVLRLLLGFEEPGQGAVYYDGHNLADLDLQSLRQQLGVVLQNGRLVSGSIFENISGSIPLTRDEAWRAARLAGLAEDIEAMPMGMQTFVSEGGATLSGGQRQRLLIARALARKPKILLFDEATSSVDNRTQESISENIDKLNLTRVVVAHRLSTIKNADMIYVLENGKVVEAGNFDQLMAENGLFARMAQRQMV